MEYLAIYLTVVISANVACIIYCIFAGIFHQEWDIDLLKALLFTVNLLFLVIIPLLFLSIWGVSAIFHFVGVIVDYLFGISP